MRVAWGGSASHTILSSSYSTMYAPGTATADSRSIAARPTDAAARTAVASFIRPILLEAKGNRWKKKEWGSWQGSARKEGRTSGSQDEPDGAVLTGERVHSRAMTAGPCRKQPRAQDRDPVVGHGIYIISTSTYASLCYRVPWDGRRWWTWVWRAPSDLELTCKQIASSNLPRLLSSARIGIPHWPETTNQIGGTRSHQLVWARGKAFSMVDGQGREIWQPVGVAVGMQPFWAIRG